MRSTPPIISPLPRRNHRPVRAAVAASRARSQGEISDIRGLAWPRRAKGLKGMDIT
jgi:hypothetical protein